MQHVRLCVFVAGKSKNTQRPSQPRKIGRRTSIDLLGACRASDDKRKSNSWCLPTDGSFDWSASFFFSAAEKKQRGGVNGKVADLQKASHDCFSRSLSAAVVVVVILFVFVIVTVVKDGTTSKEVTMEAGSLGLIVDSKDTEALMSTSKTIPAASDGTVAPEASTVPLMSDLEGETVTSLPGEVRQSPLIVTSFAETDVPNV